MSSTIPPISNPNTRKFSVGAAPEFTQVYYENAMVIGETPQWSDTAAYLGYGVEDSVANSTRVAGLCPVATQGIGWGWVQSAGYFDYLVTDGNVAAPNADTLQGDVYLKAGANGTGATGTTNVEMMGAADNSAGLVFCQFAVNLVVDTAGSIGSGILLRRF